MLQVRIFKINNTYKLWNVGADCPCHYTPEWKTYKGAERWAVKHNFEVIK